MKLMPKTEVPEGPLVLIVLQVHDDTQILANSKYIKSFEELVETMHPILRKKYPDHTIVVKEHPKDILRKSYKSFRKRFPDICWMRKGDLNAVLAASDLVVTVNSSVGLQALADHKKVLLLGEAFYSNNPFIEKAESKEDIPKKVDKLREKTLSEAEIDEYIGIFRDEIFIKGSPANFDSKTMNLLLNYILRGQ
jgi:capsule polysaccharide modification protein KpsS